jgi:hypothetical protein
VQLKGETGVSLPCDVIKYEAQKLSKSHVMWHQFHATMGLQTYEVDDQVSSLLKNALLETATRFCGEVCSFSGTSHFTSQNEWLHSEQSKKSWWKPYILQYAVKLQWWRRLSKICSSAIR